MTAVLGSVNIGRLLVADWAGSVGHTGIDKRPASGRVRISRLGIDGDEISDRRHHGGFDQALYAHATEDLAWWAGELGRDLPPGSAGENLSTVGLDLTNAVIGEQWRVGTTRVQLSAPRIPCRVFAGFWGVPDLIKRFTAHAAPGSYLRVLDEGELGAGDLIEVVHRPSHGVTVGTALRALTTQPELLPLLMDVPELAAKPAQTVRKRVPA
jgi:MOSC domain-containing protein YiiM